jgi:hypothetical protein
LANDLGELPRRARLGEPTAPVIGGIRRRAVISESCREVELVEDIERRLTEVRLGIDVLLGVERRVTLDRVLKLERHRPDEHAAHRAELPELPGIEALTESDRPGEILIEAVVGRAGKVVIDLVVDQFALGHPPGCPRGGGADG